jgi:hypothetical protein
MNRTFFNAKGKPFASLEGNILHKSEHQKDRLKITGGTSYAIDADLLEEAINEGAEVLEISEKAIPAGKRIFRIPLRDIYRYGRKVALAGVSRWTVPLPACELVSGLEEAWRLEARAELLRASLRESQVREIRGEQGTLFSDTEKTYWKNRMGYET